jgi:hypothetical protein
VIFVPNTTQEDVMMNNSGRNTPLLFTDEQTREFIVNGYTILQLDVPDQLHETICQKLQFVFDEEFNPGNNILPRVPELHYILNSPEVRGAIISVLGENYIEHPHRHCHYISPKTDDGPLQRTVADNCHQDTYTPLGRARQHYPRYARIMYYPQDTPIELGPTYVTAGTQYNKIVTDEDRSSAIPMAGKAGTVSITHFDVVHAAGINSVNQPRHMLKFVYVRFKEPTTPSWNCKDTQWQQPWDIQAPDRLDLAWSHIWDWMCGKRDRYDSFRSNGARNGNLGTNAVPGFVNMLNGDQQGVRVDAIYALGAIGAPAVEPLIHSLKASGRQEDVHPAPRPWHEGAIPMDDAAYALTAIGSPAVPGLVDLLNDRSEWVRINAAFALGEMDSAAASAIPGLAGCLDDYSHRVVRTATDALGIIRQNAPAFISHLSRLLSEVRPEWDEVLTRGWSAHDQVRVNAAMAFTRLGPTGAQAEPVLIQALDDSCGHVAAFAMDALLRIGSPLGMKAAMEYLQSRRWDESIVKGRLY